MSVYTSPAASHYWKLGEAAGQARSDSIGISHYSEQGGNVQSAAGKNGNAANGNNDTKYLAATAGLSLVPPFSLAFWAKMNSLPGSTVQFITGQDVNDPYIVIDSFGDCLAGNSNDGDLVSLSFGSLGVWNLVVLKVEAGIWSLSTNDAAFTSAAGVSPTGTALNILGNGNAFDGLMDEMAFWNSGLSQGNVDELWNGGAGTFYGTSSAGPTAVELALRKPTARVVALL